MSPWGLLVIKDSCAAHPVLETGLTGPEPVVLPITLTGIAGESVLSPPQPDSLLAGGAPASLTVPAVGSARVLDDILRLGLGLVARGAEDLTFLNLSGPALLGPGPDPVGYLLSSINVVELEVILRSAAGA